MVLIAAEYRIELSPEMIRVDDPRHGSPAAWMDEQREIIGPPTNEPVRGWTVPPGQWTNFPVAVDLELGRVRPLSHLWIYDAEGTGDLVVCVGHPSNWEAVATNDCRGYRKWVPIPIQRETQWLRLIRMSPGAYVREIALYEYSPDEWARVRQQKEAERRAAIEREERRRQAREAVANRPQVDLGPPFGALPLVDEVRPDCVEPRHDLGCSPAGVLSVTQILGRAAWVIPPLKDEASWMRVRLGRDRGLEAGHAYVLVVEYPEDRPRSFLVVNAGNETRRGFHTGTTTGDALLPKYVWNHCESLRVPLSGQWERWALYFRLHDRFPTGGIPRGAAVRPDTPEDGFEVYIAQFSAPNDPMSEGLAVGKVRLFAIPDPERLTCRVPVLPEGLPRRRIFWREEMSDGVIEGRTPEQRGVTHRLDWFGFKADQMRFLGISTYCKDLLEFGACQHWDPTPYGGQEWIYYNPDTRELWGQIVERMGRDGFEILPYYEYAGSIGRQGLGPQRRARPLNRDSGYTHIAWIEKANVDITDPDTWEDLRKILDLTVLAGSNTARFAGVWFRPRAQWPISFSDATLARFSRDCFEGRTVSREQLRNDRALYGRYIAWWLEQRRAFLLRARDYLRDHGIRDAVVLFTGSAGEPGPGFPTWVPTLVTDDPERWRAVLESPECRTAKGELVHPWTLEQVVRERWYEQALLHAGLNWGSWEVHHAHPTNDPLAYVALPGVRMTYGFHRWYSVVWGPTLDWFRGPDGLAMVRHYALNEDMLSDREGRSKLGYFICDVERAGPFCMLAEVQAMATGDPTMIGYLCGNNYARGFPLYARRFHQNFLALPALPSEIVDSVCTHSNVTVRQIRTQKHGDWYAIVHTSWTASGSVALQFPRGPVLDAVTGEAISHTGLVLTNFGPCELHAWRIP
jgi:hypothetical protein